jgi:hypothetical protein
MAEKRQIFDRKMTDYFVLDVLLLYRGYFIEAGFGNFPTESFFT